MHHSQSVAAGADSKPSAIHQSINYNDNKETNI